MAGVGDVLLDGFGRIRELVEETAAGLDEGQLAHRLDGRANSIAWLLWHLTRVQDDHVAGLAEREQVWLADRWVDRFGLPFADDATGYGQSADEVAAVRADASLLIGYHDAVYDRTSEYVRTLSDDDLDVVVDDAWDPPVTRGVRLVSVLSDDLQHVGQAGLIRGLLT